MLLLQFAILNALCLSYYTYANYILSYKKPLLSNQFITNQQALQSLTKPKKGKQLRRQSAALELQLGHPLTLNSSITNKKLAIKEKARKNSSYISPKGLLGLLRSRRHIIKLDKNSLNPEIDDRISTSISPRSYTIKAKKDLPISRFGYPRAVLPIQKLFADVGVPFQKYLSPDIFHDKHDGNANSLNIELLTSDRKRLFATSWIKFDQSNLKLYGFPLKGNQNKHTFILKATNSKGKSAEQTVVIVVYALKTVLNHYVHICTTMALSEYGGNVERRLRLAKAIANYIFPSIRTHDIWIWKFYEGCIFLTFKHLPRNGQCDFDAIQTIEEKIFDDGEVNSAFQQALKGITNIVSVNVTVLNECKRSNATNADNDLGWLRDIAPVFILIAVVAVPTLISCIVCREVRRRQATMRQLQDRRMKEDREQMLLQAAEYKHECGFDSESENGDGRAHRQSRQQEEEGKRFFGFSRIADIILPEVVIDTVKQGTEILNTFLPQETREAATNDTKVTSTRRFPTVHTLHPMNKLLDMSQEEEAKLKSAEKSQVNFTSKVKGVLKFIKNPLDITTLETQLESQTNNACNPSNKPETKKLSLISTEAFLPSLSSIFGLDANERRGSLIEVKNTMSSSIRNRLKVMMNVTSKGTNNDSTKLKDDNFGENMGFLAAGETNSAYNIARKQACQLSQRLSTSTRVYNDMQGPMHIPSSEANAIQPEHGAFDSNVKRNDINLENSEETSDYSAKQGLLNRILQQSKSVIGSARPWRGSTKRNRGDMELKELTRRKLAYSTDDIDRVNEHCVTNIMRESINERKHWERKWSTPSNLAATRDVVCYKNQLWDCNYDDHGNPFRQYYNTQMNHNAENAETELHQEVTQGADFLQAAVKNGELFENADRYFVNTGEEQLEKELSLIEAAAERWKEFQRRPGRQGSSGKQTIESSLPNCYEFSTRCRENSFSCRSKLNKDISRGLQHYDPSSGNWYPAYTSFRKILPACKMFSLLESFKRGTQENLGREKQARGESMYRSNLQWYNLNDNANKGKKEVERNRRKTGMDIGSRVMFDRFPGNQYEQFEFKYEDSQVQCPARRKESKGIWTENIYGYEDEEDESDLCQSSDDETDLQDLINKIQDERSMQYRYFPNELYEKQYYSGEDVQHQNYNDEEVGFSEVRCIDSQNECIQSDLMDDRNSYRMHFDDSYEFNRIMQDQEHLAEEMRWPYSTEFSQGEALPADDDERDIAKCDEGATDGNFKQESFEKWKDNSDIIGCRRRSLTDSQLQLSTKHLETVDSPTKSEPGCTVPGKNGATTQRERRKSFLERQRRVEIPEKQTAGPGKADAPKIHVNPIFVIEERNSKDEAEERGSVEDRFDFATIKRMQSAEESAPQSSVRMRKLTYNGPFPTAYTEAEKIRKQDADIIEHQTKGYLERRRQSLQHFVGTNQPGKGSVSETDPIAIQNRTKREDVQKRIGMRRFSTPSMESWTSTPEKYYYDASGDNNISEEDVNCAGLRKDKEKKPFASGRGRAKEYTQRLLQGVSPKIRRHSTSILGQKGNLGQSGNATTNTGTFLGKIGEGKFVQTIQTKLGKKDSKVEEPKSPISKEKEKYMEDEKQMKGSPLTAIRNTLFLFSGGK